MAISWGNLGKVLRTIGKVPYIAAFFSATPSSRGLSGIFSDEAPERIWRKFWGDN
jgi:hypothetical protein